MFKNLRQLQFGLKHEESTDFFQFYFFVLKSKIRCKSDKEKVDKRKHTRP